MHSSKSDILKGNKCHRISTAVSFYVEAKASLGKLWFLTLCNDIDCSPLQISLTLQHELADKRLLCLTKGFLIFFLGVVTVGPPYREVRDRQRERRNKRRKNEIMEGRERNRPKALMCCPRVSCWPDCWDGT